MTNKKISHHEQCHMAIWHYSHPNIAMLDNRVCKDTISSRDVSSAVLSEMSNIYHEGCPLYRTSTEHICNLLSVPITMRIIYRLLAEQPISKVLWLLVQKYGWSPKVLEYGACFHPLVNHLTSLVVERQLPECGVGLV